MRRVGSNACRYESLAPHACDSGPRRGKRRIRGGRADLRRAIPQPAFRAAVARREQAHAMVAPLFARFDAILTPASPGPAPEGLGSTGEAVFNAFWTYLGTPCVTLPLLEVDGLPLGVHLDARKNLAADLSL